MEETEARARLQDESHQLRAQNDWLRSELDRLRNELQQRTGSHADAEVPFPSNLAEVGEWAHQAVPGRLIILPRAIRAAKQSVYGKPEQVFRALLTLANEYRDMRVEGGSAKKAAFDKTLEELGLRCEPTFSGVGYGEFGDTYIVDWQGERKLLDTHLKNGGNTRDPTRCLRIYFFWDADVQQAVIGSFPGHLESRLS